MKRTWVTGGALVATAAVALPAVAALSGSGGRTSNVARPPRILSVDYGRYRPQGAEQSYTAVRVTTRDPNGQVVSVEVDRIGQADGGCNLGGKRNGDTTTWTLPTRLAPGRHRLRITVGSSSCDKRRIDEATTSTVRLRVSS